jgi:hypothetical protein
MLRGYRIICIQFAVVFNSNPEIVQAAAESLSHPDLIHLILDPGDLLKADVVDFIRCEGSRGLLPQDGRVVVSSVLR